MVDLKLLKMIQQLSGINDRPIGSFDGDKRRNFTFDRQTQLVTYLLSDTPKAPETSVEASPSKTPVYTFISERQNTSFTEENELQNPNGVSKTLAKG